jgi:hypothetical protein
LYLRYDQTEKLQDGIQFSYVCTGDNRNSRERTSQQHTAIAETLDEAKKRMAVSTPRFPCRGCLTISYRAANGEALLSFSHQHHHQPSHHYEVSPDEKVQVIKLFEDGIIKPAKIWSILERRARKDKGEGGKKWEMSKQQLRNIVTDLKREKFSGYGVDRKTDSEAEAAIKIGEKSALIREGLDSDEWWEVFGFQVPQFEEVGKAAAEVAFDGTREYCTKKRKRRLTIDLTRRHYFRSVGGRSGSCRT